MAKHYVTDAEMAAVAEAIRAKAGTEDKLSFPEGFVDGITNLPSGGGDDGTLKGIIERTVDNPTLPSDLTNIGNYVFQGCKNLTLISLPSGVTSIGVSAFQGCKNLALTSLPSGVTSIGSSAFNQCTNLALTSLPSGVTSIGSSAFQYCTGLTSITFEGKPTSTINSRAFNDCTNLLTINVPWAEGEVANAPWGATNATINYNYTGEA